MATSSRLVAEQSSASNGGVGEVRGGLSPEALAKGDTSNKSRVTSNKNGAFAPFFIHAVWDIYPLSNSDARRGV